MSKSKHILALVAAAALVAGCAGSGGSAGGSTPTAAELDALTQKIVDASVHDKGIVKVQQVFAEDETLRACNAADVAGKPLDAETAKRIEALNMQTIKWPADGKYLGDWKAGEALAQSGRNIPCVRAIVARDGSVSEEKSPSVHAPLGLNRL